ncbi:hypothetical protein BYT27DRAFT_7228036 [Phlegmacium glaucopus]|nr:hypothetical protein BYT27DRAFT_7228036 [Phlegmacium glaucopus]
MASEVTSQDIENKRIFPPLYVPNGDVSKDRLAFIHILERLKTQKRTGWVDHKIPNPERYTVEQGKTNIVVKSSCSISDHMYRMAVLSMLCDDATIDISKCVMMAIVHDLAEAQVGDIAPREGIPKAEKHRLEAEAMHNFVHDMLHNSQAAQRIESLWREYEDGQSPEAKFVKDLDRFEMASQALEYERNHEEKGLQIFYHSSLPNIRHPQVQQWGQDLMAEREELQKKK